MSSYNWTGIDYQGTKLQGTCLALTTFSCKHKLIKQNIFPIKITRSNYLNKKLQKKIQSNHITSFSRKLATLINANLPLVAAITLIADDPNNVALQKVLYSIKQQLENGQSLTRALEKHPQVFNELFCSLINIGEKTGSLDVMLQYIANHREKSAMQHRKIKQALLYPALVMSVTVIVTAILLIFVLPQFETIFAGFDVALPFYTTLILSLAKFLKLYAWIILGIFILVIFSIKLACKKSVQFAIKIDHLILQLPWFGTINKKSISYRVLSTLAIAFKAGIPLLEALTLSAKTAQNKHYTKIIHQIINSIANGMSLSKSIQQHKLLPTPMLHLLKIGEESGNLDTMLEKMSDIYAEEIDYFVSNLQTLLEPVLMLLLGIIVGSLLIALYLPIFRLGNVI